MLEKFTICNFQKYKQFEITFDPNISVIIGESDVGKSSIIRALLFLIKNQCSGGGEVIHHNFDQNNEISLELLIDNHKIVRKKGKKDNLYQLDDKKEVYRAFGKDVPEDISKILNIETTNFSGQFSNVFLISDTPGQVSRELNKIIDLDCIDKSLSEVGSEVKKSKLTVELIRNRLKEAKNRKNELVWVIDIDRKLKGLEEMNETLSRIAVKGSRISSLIENGSNTLLRKRTLSRAISRISTDFSDLDVLGKKLVKIQEKNNRISNNLIKYTNIKHNLIKIKEELQQKSEEFNEKLGSKCPLCNNLLGKSEK